MNKMKFSRLLRIVLFVVLTSGAFGATAWATSPETTTVSAVQYSQGNLLLKDSAGTWFYAQLVTQTCAIAWEANLDTIKIWTSQAQSALLAGKNVKIWYSNCGSTNYITGLELDQ